MSPLSFVILSWELCHSLLGGFECVAHRDQCHNDDAADKELGRKFDDFRNLDGQHRLEAHGKNKDLFIIIIIIGT